MIPILMDASKSVTELCADNTAGIGPLNECQKCEVTEERNGAYVLTMKLPITAKYYDSVEVGGVIKAKANETSRDQLFRISKITKPISGIVTISANHITYDLSKTSVLPCRATGASAAMLVIMDHMQGGDGFTLSSDIVGSSSTYRNTIPQSCRACFGGSQGSLLDTFGGEYEWDNNNVILHAHRGEDRGVVLRYGKNIIDLQQEENIESTYTAVMPYAIQSGGDVITGTLHTIVESTEPRILNLDLSNKFTDQAEITVEKIDEAATAYIKANNLTTPKVSIKVSFLQLADTEEYKNIIQLEHVRLCDTVRVEYPKLGVSAKAKVIKTVYDTLKEKYNEIEIGEAKSTLAKTITGISDANEITATGYTDQAISAFSALIAQGLGLYVTKVDTGGGALKMYLHNKPTLEASQYQWTINANGLALSQDYGNTWQAGIDSQGNAIFNAISANVVNAMKINSGALTFGDTKKMTLGEDSTGALFNGQGTLRINTYDSYTLANYETSGKPANSVYVGRVAQSDSIVHNQSLVNYDLDGLSMNSITLQFKDGEYDDGSIQLINRNCSSDHRGKLANRIVLRSYEDANGTTNVQRFSTYNYRNPDSEGAYMQMQSTRDNNALYIGTHGVYGTEENYIQIQSQIVSEILIKSDSVNINTLSKLNGKLVDWRYCSDVGAYVLAGF